jgi:hypothetical protein
MSEQDDLTVGKLNGVVVCTRIVQVDLSEPPNPVRDVPRLLLEKTQEKSSLLTPHLAFERKLGTGQQAHRDLRFSNRGESLGCRVPKLRRNQLVADLGGP